MNHIDLIMSGLGADLGICTLQDNSISSPVASKVSYTTITATLLDADTADVLPFANIYEEDNTTNGVTSDLTGTFSITIPVTSTLVISYVGYKTQTFSAQNVPSTISLEMEAETLEEVVLEADAKKSNWKYLGYAILGGALLMAFTRKKKEPVKVTI